MRERTHWFRHDASSRDDNRIALLTDQLGMEGYGIYWAIIETLWMQDDYRYPVEMLLGLAQRHALNPEKTQAVVLNYGLFEVHEDDSFSSLLLSRHKRTSSAPRSRRGGTDSSAYRSFDHLSISVEEVERLKAEGHSVGDIDDILDSIENFRGNKKYNSLYLTARAWLRRVAKGNRAANDAEDRSSSYIGG